MRKAKPEPQLHPDLAAAIREVLERSAQPLPLAKLRTALPGPYKVPLKLKDALLALLADEARAGRLHEWPGVKYWTRDCRAWAEPLMLAAAVEPVASGKVIGAVLKVYGRPQAEALLADLVRNGWLIRVPLFGGGAKAKVCSRIADEVAFRTELDDARRVIDAGYRRLGDADRAASDGSGLPRLAVPLDDHILTAIADLEPHKGLLVTAPRLYRAFPDIPKSEIDAALLRLQDARRVILHKHSNPQQGSDLIANLYVGACWRVDQ